MSSQEHSTNGEIHRLPTPGYYSGEPSNPDDYDEHRGKATPLIIDNGATYLRWGFSTSSSPKFGPNIVSKYRERRSNKPLVLFGAAVDIDSTSKSQTRTAWEGDVLLNFDALENALDYAFLQLGIDTPNGLEHPVLMTERLASPFHSRSLTSELMFEQYSVPSLAFSVDGLMSFYQNHGKSDGLVLSFNTASTSVIPMLNGKGIMSHAQRIPWGSAQATEYLLKLVQLKYPTFPTRVTFMQSNWMLQQFCSFSNDYLAHIRSLRSPDTLRASEVVVQFPFALPQGDEKSEEELARLAERRREQGKKLQEMAAERRQEKVAQKEEDLRTLVDLRESRDGETRRDWLYKLSEEGIQDEDELDQAIKKLEIDLKRAHKKDAENEDPVEEPSFPLLDVPDEDLDEAGIKEKKKQRLLKAGFDAREKIRKEKEREKEEREAAERMDEEEREADPSAWARKMRSNHEGLLNKIKERARRKAALTDRKSAAAQARMKNIANLAQDERIPKKKRKAAGGEDMFGADDADWAIYRKINTAAESSDEEEDWTRLQTVEGKLLTHDPTFTENQTHAFISAKKSELLNTFKPVYEEGDVEGSTRIHLNTERARVCEAWFQPGMAGVDSAGLGETMQNILARFSVEDRGKLASNVFLTGSPSQLPGLQERVYSTLRPILPPEMSISVKKANDPVLDAWKGMAKFANSERGEFEQISITKAEYDEWGPERVKRWWGGNWNGSKKI